MFTDKSAYEYLKSMGFTPYELSRIAAENDLASFAEAFRVGVPIDDIMPDLFLFPALDSIIVLRGVSGEPVMTIRKSDI